MKNTSGHMKNMSGDIKTVSGDIFFQGQSPKVQ
jgi:hypothetical protein